MMRVAVYVSGHGFGHATRQAALMEALCARTPAEFLLRTEAPAELFSAVPAPVRHAPDRFDVGMLQRSALLVDMPATLKAHQSLVSEFDALVERERARLIDFNPDVVVSDCGPAPMEAAKALGIPAVTIGSFTWDWILEEFEAADPRWSPVVRRYEKAYSAADAYWRLPFHGDDGRAFKQVRDFPHLVRRPKLNRAETLAALGLSPEEARPIITVAFGGFETEAFTGADPDSLSRYVFVGFTAPPPGFKAEWIRLPKQAPLPVVDLVRSSSVLIGKFGYGTVAECLVYGIRMLYVPRPGIREIPFIERAAHSAGGFQRLPAEDFFSVRWERALDRILEAPHPAFAQGDGADQIAEALLEFAGVRA